MYNSGWKGSPLLAVMVEAQPHRVIHHFTSCRAADKAVITKFRITPGFLVNLLMSACQCIYIYIYIILTLRYIQQWTKYGPMTKSISYGIYCSCQVHRGPPSLWGQLSNNIDNVWSEHQAGRKYLWTECNPLAQTLRQTNNAKFNNGSFDRNRSLDRHPISLLNCLPMAAYVSIACRH